MPKRLSIQPRLSMNDLERRYRTVTELVAHSHWQMVWLLAQGRASEQVAASTGYSAKWIRTVAQHRNQYGPSGLGDGRHSETRRPSPAWLGHAPAPRLAAESVTTAP